MPDDGPGNATRLSTRAADFRAHVLREVKADQCPGTTSGARLVASRWRRHEQREDRQPDGGFAGWARLPQHERALRSDRAEWPRAARQCRDDAGPEKARLAQAESLRDT